jgi:hypothetical protein
MFVCVSFSVLFFIFLFVFLLFNLSSYLSRLLTNILDECPCVATVTYNTMITYIQNVSYIIIKNVS